MKNIRKELDKEKNPERKEEKKSKKSQKVDEYDSEEEEELITGKKVFCLFVCLLLISFRVFVLKKSYSNMNTSLFITISYLSFGSCLFFFFVPLHLSISHYMHK